jgi:hypothetical protein
VSTLAVFNLAFTFAGFDDNEEKVERDVILG